MLDMDLKMQLYIIVSFSLKPNQKQKITSTNWSITKQNSHTKLCFVYFLSEHDRTIVNIVCMFNKILQETIQCKKSKNTLTSNSLNTTYTFNDVLNQ